MNADQRKFLVERVNQTFNKQKKAIDEGRTEKPSLNNYLIAAFLDNSIKFQDIEKLKEKMRAMVLRFGSGDVLIKTNGWSRNYNKRGDTTVEINAEDLFVYPESYEKAWDEWYENKIAIDKAVEKLEAEKDTILLKIQIGSNAALDKIITQVDNIADLNIMNAQFMLT